VSHPPFALLLEDTAMIPGTLPSGKSRLCHTTDHQNPHS
jgi:hypothetical protein